MVLMYEFSCPQRILQFLEFQTRMVNQIQRLDFYLTLFHCVKASISDTVPLTYRSRNQKSYFLNNRSIRDSCPCLFVCEKTL